MDMMVSTGAAGKLGELHHLVDRINSASERLESIAGSLGRHADMVFGCVPTDISNVGRDGQDSPAPLIAQLSMAIERLHENIGRVYDEAERNTRLA